MGDLVSIASSKTRVSAMNDESAARSAPEVWTDLLKRVAQENDQQAFRQLYLHFAPRIKAYAINQGFGQHADVLAQEVMTQVWRKASHFNPSIAAASTWIFTIARNQRIDILRKLKRTQCETHIETEALWELPIDDITIASIQQASTANYIGRHLAQLPEEQLIALRKVYYEGKTHEDVATELNIPLGTIKGRIRLALKKLRVSFAQVSL
jgi:RNA polymerase sigma factor (sigma-70 family)